MRSEVIEKCFSFGGKADLGKVEYIFARFNRERMLLWRDGKKGAFDFGYGEKSLFWHSEQNLRCAKEGDGE